jgi:hypothetical protein
VNIIKINIDSFNRTKHVISQIIKWVTFAECTAIDLDKFNHTYKSHEGENIVNNIFNSVLIKTQEELDHNVIDYKFWVRNNALCCLVEELHYLNIELLKLLKLQKKRIPVDAIFSEFINSHNKEIDKKFDYFNKAFEELNTILKFHKNDIRAIKSLIEIRNSITHDKVVSAEKNRTKLCYYTLKLYRCGTEDQNFDNIYIKKELKEKILHDGNKVELSYQEINEIAYTVSEFIKTLENNFKTILQL